MPYRSGSRPWRISQMHTGASIEEAWPFVVGFIALIIVAFLLIRHFSK